MVNQELNSSQRTPIYGFLNHRSQWNEAVAMEIASQEGIELTSKHWDIIQFLRTEFYANSGVLPTEYEVIRGMGRWQKPLTVAELVSLFPQGLLSQGAKIAGCITVSTVSDLLLVKGDAVWTTESDQLVINALKTLSDKNIGALMVVENEKLVGVVSERDFTRDVLLQGRVMADVKVADIMTRDVISVAPDTSLEECMELMTDCGFRHLPVLEQGRLVGVLSMPDLVRVIVEQQRFVITQLKSQQQSGLKLN